MDKDWFKTFVIGRNIYKAFVMLVPQVLQQLRGSRSGTISVSALRCTSFSCGLLSD